MSLIRTPVYATKDKEIPQILAVKEIARQFTEFQELFYQVSLFKRDGRLLGGEEAEVLNEQVNHLQAKIKDVEQALSKVYDTQFTEEIKGLMNKIQRELNLGGKLQDLKDEVKAGKEKVDERVEKSKQAQENRAEESDDYAAKLVKYIPSEVVVAFTAVVVLADQVKPKGLADPSIWIALIVGFLATPSYFWVRSLNLSADKKPEWFMYALSPIAFIFWALAISEPTRELLNIGTEYAQYLLALAAFVIPFLDEVFTAAKKRLTAER